MEVASLQEENEQLLRQIQNLKKTQKAKGDQQLLGMPKRPKKKKKTFETTLEEGKVETESPLLKLDV